MMHSAEVGCGTGVEFDRTLFQRSPGDLPCSRSLEVPEEAGSCGSGGKAAIANVGYAVAVGVGAVGVRMPRKIGSEAVGRRQARTFADEDETKARSEMETDRIADGDPAL